MIHGRDTGRGGAEGRNRTGHRFVVAHRIEHVGLGPVGDASPCFRRAVAIHHPAAHRDCEHRRQEHQQCGERREHGQFGHDAIGVYRVVDQRDDPHHEAADHAGEQTGQQPAHRQVAATVRVGVGACIGHTVEQSPRERADTE